MRVTFPAKYHGQCMLALAVVMLLGGLVTQPCLAAAPSFAGLPTIQLGVSSANSPQEVSQGLQILILLTILTLAPAMLILTTAFTRIVIVMSLVRQAIGIPNLPPNQVILGLSLILTFFVMAPTFNTINEKALQPYIQGNMAQQTALNNAIEPLRLFMFKQTHEKDIALFTKLAKLPKPKTTKDVPTYVLLPSFIISELKTAFQLGFMIFLPFLVIDLVISSVLVSMGMMFLPPASIALPFKIILFVLADGWQLISQALVLGFN
ncbi:MAG: flagellar type III secretion system pore protein FliP [Vampirovibrionales bacterium]|nr:flagellar type III secretion system pore protein FliP [Vampirovibrionales bacterium]